MATYSGHCQTRYPYKQLQEAPAHLLDAPLSPAGSASSDLDTSDLDTSRAFIRRTSGEDEQKRLGPLEEEKESVEIKVSELGKQLQDFDALWKSRRRPLEEEIESYLARKQELERQIEVAKAAENDYEVPPGPKSLRWVDGSCFGATCNIIVVLNLTSMIFGPKFPKYAGLLKALDHVFMVWYVFELTVKFVLHQRKLLCGKVSVVWWNWLDLTIVVSGVIDMWLIPLIMLIGGGSSSHHHGPSMAALRTLRLCRLFRLLRFLRLLKLFFQSDLAWADSAQFQVFMSAVIAVNAVVMSLELDYPGPVWTWVENVFLVIYSFELSIRMKRQRLMFFYRLDTLMWNYLDMVIVGGGIVDLWLMPLMHWFQSSVLGQEVSPHSSGGNITSLLKMMRILRVLRLVRLLKAIKPLYRLLLGVIESLKAMQWVMVLTLLMLYAAAIFWTSLVGKGILYQGETPEEVIEVFGSVPRSLFSLFRLMNGDTDVVSAVTTTVFGQLLFVSFMVLSNWAILAILTSVVSDNMIAASTRAQEEEDKVQKQSDHEARCARLMTLFKEIDQDGSGAISSEEWKGMCQDKGLMHELCDATMLEPRDLEELFQFLSVDAEYERKRSVGGPSTSRFQSGDEKILHYEALIDHLRSDGDPADRRSVLCMLSRMQAMEQIILRRFDKLENSVGFN